MNTALLVTGSIFVAIAALFHVYFFYLESVAWTKPRTWKLFGIPNQATADTIKAMAFNQGFYNLFLGIGAIVGLVLLASVPVAGLALVFMAAGSMVLAALVLLLSSSNRRAAIIQGAPPLIGLVFMLLALAF